MHSLQFGGHFFYRADGLSPRQQEQTQAWVDYPGTLALIPGPAGKPPEERTVHYFWTPSALDADILQQADDAGVKLTHLPEEAIPSSHLVPVGWLHALRLKRLFGWHLAPVPSSEHAGRVSNPRGEIHNLMAEKIIREVARQEPGQVSKSALDRILRPLGF